LCCTEFDRQGACVPVLLQCGHTTCRTCASRIADSHATSTKSHLTNALACAVCRSITHLPANGVDGLQVNHGVLGVLDQIHLDNEQLQQQQAGSMCDNCSVNKSAVLFCQTCEVQVCGECFASIHSIKALRGHTSTPVVVNKVDITCNQHKQDKLLYCNTCSRTVCAMCVFSGSCKEHRDDVQEMQQMEETMQEAVRHEMSQLKEVQDVIRQHVTKVDELMGGE